MTTTQRRNAWRRWVLVLGTLAAILVLVWRFRGERIPAKHFLAQSQILFRALSEGRAGQVYDEAAFGFREVLVRDRFIDIQERIATTLGRFVAIANVKSSTRYESLRGVAATVEYRVEYENAETTAVVSYLRREEHWRLLGLKVYVPDSLAASARKLEHSADHVAAPQEAIDLVFATLELARRHSAKEIRDGAAPQFQEGVTEENFIALLKSHENQLGHFVRIVTILSSAQDQAKRRATVHAFLEYDRDKTTGNFDFLKIDGAWRLLSYKVAIPQPLLPASEPTIKEPPPAKDAG